MHRTLTISIVLVILTVPLSIVYLEYEHSNSQPTSQNLNESVREGVSEELNLALSYADYNNVSLNASNIVNSVMNRFYVLQNNTTFQSYYRNYSQNFTVGGGFEFNRTLFNTSNLQGLDLDYFYFLFSDIYTRSSVLNGIEQPLQLGTITYSINVGTGQISGPKLSWNWDIIS